MVSKYEPPSDTNNANILIDSGSDQHVAFGTFLIIVQVCCMGLLLVLQKTLLNRYDSTVLTFSYYAVATGITLSVSVCAVVLGDSPSSAMDLITFEGRSGPWLALLYAAFSTFYTNNAYAWAGKQVSPSVTAIYNTFQPVFTALLSVVILHEVLSIFELAGSALVIMGMVVTLYGRQLEVKETLSQSKKES